MASQADIEATYDYLDGFWRAAFGENPDITAALYDGDYSKSLEQAQHDKHIYILQSVGFRRGCRVLDIGCGWGGFLRTVQESGGSGVGLTLSRRQADACRRAGLSALVCDWKTTSAQALGAFDAVVSVGAFEHFCSEEEYLAGDQARIYRRFFALCADLLPARGRLYVQTMLWGNAVPDPAAITHRAKRGSDAQILGLLRKFYPGSWLPAGLAQIQAAAHPFFDIVCTKNGRLDYLATMAEWGRRARQVRMAPLAAALRLVPRALVDPDLRSRLRSMAQSCNEECFRRRLMDHERIVFERTAAS